MGIDWEGESDGEPVAASGIISKATAVHFMQNHYRSLPTQVQYVCWYSIYCTGFDVFL